MTANPRGLKRPTVQQRDALGGEVFTAILLIEAGLGHLQRNYVYQIPMLLLANGFERLMKTIICFHDQSREEGKYPDIKFFKGLGHDLVEILDQVLSRCFTSDYLERPAAASDAEYLRNDARFHTILKILSDFGEAQRYYNLDFACGKTPTTESPNRLWDQLEIEVLQDDPEWIEKLKSPERIAEAHRVVNSELVVRLEKFARALARLFTLGNLGPEAKRLTGYVQPFLPLTDESLGKRDYLKSLGA